MIPLAAHRNHSAWWAFALHRVSGVLLALFLPVHFRVLAMAIDSARLDGMLRWTEHPLVKLAEAGLVLLLAAHLTGGLRLLAVEFLPWRDWQKTLVALASGLSVAVAILFLLNAA
jgi:fumarate reductase subunit D